MDDTNDAYETKAAGGDLAGMVSQMAAGFEAYKRENEVRLAEIEKRGHADPLIEEKIERIGAYIDGQKSALDRKRLERARAEIRDRLSQLAPMLMKTKYMLGDEFSMLDVAIAPLLWRLDHYGIELPKNAAPLQKYAERIFSRPAFIEALTPSEKVMRR